MSRYAHNAIAKDKRSISNEFYTPREAVIPLLKHLEKFRERIGKENLTIWCPFSVKDPMVFEEGVLRGSEFVRVFRKNGHRVIHSHIFEGKDFFEYEPEEEYDLIVDNPPFVNKRAFFERALELGKPFLFLMTILALNEKFPKVLFSERGIDLEILLFDKRISYWKPDGTMDKRPPFASAYMGTGVLEKNLIIERVGDDPRS